MNKGSFPCPVLSIILLSERKHFNDLGVICLANKSSTEVDGLWCVAGKCLIIAPIVSSVYEHTCRFICNIIF